MLMYLLFKYVFNIFAISMEKEIRLKKMVDEESYAIFISLYKEFRANPKYSRSDFILLKSFLAKIVYAQKHVTIYHSTSQIPMYRAFEIWYMFIQHIPYLYYTYALLRGTTL